MNEELELLLPWYVNGTLDEASRKKIDEALALDENLRRSLQLAREDQQAAFESNEAITPPPAATLERIMAAAAASGRARRHSLKLSLAEAFRGFVVSLSPRALAAVAAVLAVVIALQTVTISVMGLKGPGVELASVEPGGQSEATARLIVGFAPGATVEQVTTLLDSLGLRIVQGPTGGGLYVVEVAVSEATGPEGEKVLQQLQGKRDMIIFSAKAPPQEN